MIIGKYLHEFRCPACGLILARRVHGNVKRVKSTCMVKHRIDVLLTKVRR